MKTIYYTILIYHKHLLKYLLLVVCGIMLSSSTFSFPSDIVVPDVTSFTAQPGYRFVKLTWEMPYIPVDYIFLGVHIQRSLSNDSIGWANAVRLNVETDAATITDTNLSLGTTYYYIAKIVIMGRDNGISPGVIINATPDYLPNIDRYTYQFNYPNINLYWSNPTSNLYQSTIIVRKANALPVNLSDGDVIYTGTGTYCQDSGLFADTTYYYRSFVNPTSYTFGTTNITIHANQDFHVLSAMTEGNNSCLDVQGKYLYLGGQVHGFYIYDIANPIVPVQISYCGSHAEVNRICVEGKYAYLVEDTTGVEIVDISDPYHPYAVGSIPTQYTSCDIAIDGDYAYIAEGDGGLKIVDVRDPVHPVLVSILTTGYYSQVIYQNHYIYAGHNAQITVFDVNDPYVPVINSYTNLESYPIAGRFYLKDNRLYYPYATYEGNPYKKRLPSDDWYVSIFMKVAAISGDTSFIPLNSYSLWSVNPYLLNPYYFNDISGNDKYLFANTDEDIYLIDVSQVTATMIRDMGHGFYSLQARGNRLYGAGNNEWGIMQYSAFTEDNHIEIGEGPKSDANPVNARDTVTCFVYPSDNWGCEAFIYQWSVNTGVLSNGTSASPVWIAPVNSSCTVQYYPISLAIENEQGTSTTVAYLQGVRPHLENVHIFRVTPIDDGVKLTWRNPVSKNYSGTRIRRKEGGYPSGPTDGVQVYWYNGEMCNDVGLLNGKTYYYAAFSHDSALKYTTGAYTSIYIPWSNTFGKFNQSGDTAGWGYEIPKGVDGVPAVSWLTTYDNRTGVVCFSFSTANEGVKMTSLPRFSSLSSWYRIRMDYYAINSSAGVEMASLLLGYNDLSSYRICEVGGYWTGNGQVETGQWYRQDSYIYSASSVSQFQLVMKNHGAPGMIYLDMVNIDTIKPPALLSSQPVPVTIGDFDESGDTSGWAVEPVPQELLPLPTCSWVSTYSDKTGVFVLSFNQENEGIKLTSIPTFAIASGKNAVMSFNAFSDLTDCNQLQVIGYLYGETNVDIFKVDFAAKAFLGTLSGGSWNTIRIPLTSVSGATIFRMQLIFKNGNQLLEKVYLDDIQLETESTATTSQWVELIEPAEESKRLVTAFLPKTGN